MVLVILAILAAILVPALLGWIDKAKEKQIVLNAKVVMQSAQTVLGSMYAEADDPTQTPSLTNKEITEIAEIADLKTAYIFDLTLDTTGTKNRDKYKIIDMTYTEGTNTIKFNGKTWKKHDTAATKYNVTAANVGTVTP